MGKSVFVEDVYTVRVYSKAERDRRARTAEVFVSVVSVSRLLASHTHYRLLKDESVCVLGFFYVITPPCLLLLL